MHVNGDVDEGDIVKRVNELGYGVTDVCRDPVVMTGWDVWRDLLWRPRNVLTLIGIALIGMAFAAEWLLPVHAFTTGMFTLGALSGTAMLWMAVFADMGTSLLVTLNGMRLLKHEYYSCSPSMPPNAL